jgi:hypothetical protein
MSMYDVSDYNCTASLQLLKIIPDDDNNNVADPTPHPAHHPVDTSSNNLTADNGSLATSKSRKPVVPSFGKPFAVAIKKEMGEDKEAFPPPRTLQCEFPLPTERAPHRPKLREPVRRQSRHPITRHWTDL